MRKLVEVRVFLGRAVIVIAALIAAVIISELAYIEALHYSLAVRGFVWDHHWLRMHSDDRSILRPLIDLWLSSIALFVLSLVSVGRTRRQAFMTTAGTVLGIPALFFLLMTI